MQTSPSQKALIQLAESMAITALIAGIASIGNLLIGNGQINWAQVGISFALAIVFSLGHSLSAYLKAIPAQQPSQGQVQPDYSELGNILDTFLNDLQQRLDKASVPVVQAPVAQPQIAQQANIPAFTATNAALKAVNLVAPPAQQ
jgi:hypothetical protein